MREGKTVALLFAAMFSVPSIAPGTQQAHPQYICEIFPLPPPQPLQQSFLHIKQCLDWNAPLQDHPTTMPSHLSGYQVQLSPPQRPILTILNMVATATPFFTLLF